MNKKLLLCLLALATLTALSAYFVETIIAEEGQKVPNATCEMWNSCSLVYLATPGGSGQEEYNMNRDSNYGKYLLDEEEGDICYACDDWGAVKICVQNPTKQCTRIDPPVPQNCGLMYKGIWTPNEPEVARNILFSESNLRDKNVEGWFCSYDKDLNLYGKCSGSPIWDKCIWPDPEPEK